MDYKNQFVDENSYLVYGSEPDTAYDGSGGGSGDLPIASADSLGGVKIGGGISVTSDGTISTGGGSSSIYLLDTANATYDSEEYTYTFTDTYGDIANALNNGKTILLKWHETTLLSEYTHYCSLQYFMVNEEFDNNETPFTGEIIFGNNKYFGTDVANSLAVLLAKQLVIGS